MTPAEMREHLDADHGDAPASPYGVKFWQWGEVAVAAGVVLQGETGEDLTPEAFDHLVGLVVNGHDDPGYLIATYGAEYNIDPADYFDADELIDYREASV